MKNRILVFLVLGLLLITALAFAEEKNFEIRAKKFAYTPNIIRVSEGDEVRIRLISEDVHHGFFLDAYELETSALPSKDGTITFVANRTGRFSFRCSVTCGEFHPYMIGYLYVTPNTNWYAGLIIVALMGIGSLIFVLVKKRNNPNYKFLGIIPMSWKFELTKFKLVRKLLKSRWFPFILIVLNLFVFTVIIVAFFVGGFGAGNYNFGVMIVWILWWSLLMMFMVPALGRFWCMICPFPLFGDWIQRGKLVDVGRQKSWGLNKRWPRKFRNLWPLVILFWVSTWFSGFFTVRPYASLVLIGSIILLATLVAMFYRQRGFCLSVCPVSGFQGLYSNFALIEVRVKDPKICEDHKQKTCVTGNEEGYGCPWMELPYDMNRNTYCGLCMECFKTCPYDNMALNIRPPGADFLTDRKRTDDMYNRRGTDEAFKALTMIGIMLTFFMGMQGPSAYFKDMMRATTLEGYGLFVLESALVDFILIPLSFLIFVFLSKKVSGNEEVKLKEVFVNFSYALVPVGIAVWGAFSLGIIMPNGSYILHILSDPFAWGWDLFGTAKYAWTPFFTDIMPYLQIFFISVGLLFALDLGYNMSLRTYGTTEEAKRGWIPMLVYLLAAHVFFFWLFLG